jgi:hypothetical protein
MVKLSEIKENGPKLKTQSGPVHGLLQAPGCSEGLGQRTLPPPRPKVSPTCVDRWFQSDGHPFISVEQSHLRVIAPSKTVAISHFWPKWERKSGARWQYGEALKRRCHLCACSQGSECATIEPSHDGDIRWWSERAPRWPVNQQKAAATRLGIRATWEEGSGRVVADWVRKIRTVMTEERTSNFSHWIRSDGRRLMTNFSHWMRSDSQDWWTAGTPSPTTTSFIISIDTILIYIYIYIYHH